MGHAHARHALRHRRHLIRHLRRTKTTNQHSSTHHTNQQVHRRATQHNHHALEHRQLIEQAVLIAGLQALSIRRTSLLSQGCERARTPRMTLLMVFLHLSRARRVHANHRNVAAQRDRLETVLSLAAAEREHGLTEANHVLRDAHIEQLRGHQMPHLVQGNRDGNSDCHEDNAHSVQQDFHAFSRFGSGIRSF